MFITINLPGGRQMLDTTPDVAAGAGVSQDLIDAAVLLERRKAVSAECQRRIFALASKNAQRNLGVKVGLISAKPESDRTDADVAFLAGAVSADVWVHAMRAAFETLVADTAVDFTADSAWPAPSQEVLDLVAQI